MTHNMQKQELLIQCKEEPGSDRNLWIQSLLEPYSPTIIVVNGMIEYRIIETNAIVVEIGEKVVNGLCNHVQTFYCCINTSRESWAWMYRNKWNRFQKRCSHCGALYPIAYGANLHLNYCSTCGCFILNRGETTGRSTINK